MGGVLVGGRLYFGEMPCFRMTVVSLVCVCLGGSKHKDEWMLLGDEQGGL